MSDSGPVRRRRRRRSGSPQGPPPTAADGATPITAGGAAAKTAATVDPTPTPTPTPTPAAAAKPAANAKPAGSGRRRPARDGAGPGDRGLRDLVGAGHSQVGVSGAMRARDVNRPTAEDLAEADCDLEIIRRNWKPDESH